MCCRKMFVRLSHVVILSKRLNISSPHHSSMAIFRRRPPNEGIKCKGYEKNRDFQLIFRVISEMIQDRATVAIECEQETTPQLSNDTSFNDLD